MVKQTKSIILITTYDCNLRCSYCYEPKTGHKYLTVPMAKTIIERAMKESKAAGFNEMNLQFMGGEPLMRFGLIREVCEWLWNRDNEITLKNVSAPTNGTLLTPKMKEWFEKNNKRFALMLSFDGDRLMQNINRSESSRNIDINFFIKNYAESGVKMTVSPTTLKDFDKGVEYLYNIGFNVVEANLAMGNVGWKMEHLSILNRELNKICEFYLQNPYLRRMSLFNIPVINILHKDSPSTICKCGANITCYDCDGVDYACHIFSPITMSKELAAKSRSIDFEKVRKDGYSSCRNCILRKLCTRCPGINFKERGECNCQTSFDCAQFKLFFLANCKLQRRLAINDRNTDAINVINKTIALYAKLVG